MGLFSKKPVVIPDEIIKFNSFTPDKEKLLTIGAATTECKHYVETKLSGSNKDLMLYYPKNRGEKVKKYWLPMFGIVNNQSANQVISDWIARNNYTNTVDSDTRYTVQ